MEHTEHAATHHHPHGHLIGIGELIRVSWQTTMKNWTLFFGILAIPAALNLITVVFFGSKNIALIFLGIIAVLVALVLSIASQPALVDTVHRSVSNGTTDSLSVKDQYKYGFKMFGPFLWVSILSGLSMMGILGAVGIVTAIVTGLFVIVHLQVISFVLSVCIMVVATCAVAVYFSFSVYALVVDNKRGIAAIQESIGRVHRKWWPTFGRLVVLILIAVAAYALLFGIQLLIYHIFGFSLTDLEHQAVIPLGVQLTSSAIGFLAYTLIIPFLLTYSLSVFRSLGQVKTSTSPVSRGWVIGFSIFGLMVPIIMLVISLVGLISLFGNVRSQIPDMKALQQQMQQMQQQASSTNTNPLQK